MSAMFVLIKNNLSDDFHNCLFGFKVKNVFLEQGWAFAAKAMLLHSMGRAGGRKHLLLGLFLPLPPVTPEVYFVSRFKRDIFIFVLVKSIDDYWD